MVRFIMDFLENPVNCIPPFTFQYGQIYYARDYRFFFISKIIYIPIWLDLLFLYLYLVHRKLFHLHSNMVRFIIRTSDRLNSDILTFTFQYGQIYYSISQSSNDVVSRIYIPIWLDLLLNCQIEFLQFVLNLHSNMVRFIIWLYAGASYRGL